MRREVSKKNLEIDAIPDGLYRRLYICKKIWPYMLGILLSYMVTLSLFPGIESEIQSCTLGDWMPVILMATFNITDLVGKVGHSTLSYLSHLLCIFRWCLVLTTHGPVVSWSSGPSPALSSSLSLSCVLLPTMLLSSQESGSLSPSLLSLVLPMVSLAVCPSSWLLLMSGKLRESWLVI